MAQGKMWAIASIQTSELRRLSVPYCRLPSESAVRPRDAKAHRPLILPPDDRIGARGPLAVFGTYSGTLLQEFRIRKR